MIAFPPCKINLGLHVVSKRSDGFHDLETCFLPVPWTDILEIIPATQTSFTRTGTTIPGNDADNLCLRAYQLLATSHNIPPVSIHLHKVIPTGAGLGGGSSDAAHTLRLLNTIFNLNLSTEDLMNHAATLGSDCAFFVQDNPMIGRGRGEVLTPVEVNLKGKYLVLVKPDIHVSTAAAYSNIKPATPQHELEKILNMPIGHWKELLCNDFERTVFAQYPAIGSIKAQLYEFGAHYASMSGSGATVFGIFDSPIDVSQFSQHTVWTGLC
ncbi:4-(cytidine 5'-diphospho)-2-C-methyl-D-erythritol kinase [Pseudochryseolinea flava]|uniref:4-diphosphocytidyl-2-C-methyl-D-erythritol kinase n=1 Tax=Pseudochryseolinea flava TaxID=2059302 RepID=A0A364Y133_9BACT|nr:4-(cytidine 5'-diphospho)-2-C-methyl-D-erythritol kinase [Pseudochryseolinea flava]RAV99806.1 4-(cytidine 5'-diphospho)-2-C-methyl-D-erythritol kinase [Pseudochryseolinea flava]